jgi:VCBS repeat-containing protein
LRVVAEASANLPKITVSTTPSTPVLPGQTVIASVRADAWSGIADIAAEVRGSGLGDADTWQPVALDSAGRIKLLPTQPGLIELRVTATDKDGFASRQTHTVRIKDPADTTAPLLAWTDKLSGATAATQPVEINRITILKANLSEQQLMGYKLQLAPAGSDVEYAARTLMPNGTHSVPYLTDAWQTLAEHEDAANSINRQLDLTNLDPAKFANGVYQLRLTAWDLAGRTTEIEAQIIIDSAQKDLSQLTVTDNSYQLAGHTMAFNRSLDSTSALPLPGGEGGGEGIHDLGNWQLALLDTQLTNDQPTVTDSGVTAPWQQGARVWLHLPENLSNPNAAPLSLSFTLNTNSERLGQAPGTAEVFHPVFTDSQGWQLQAHTGDAANTEEKENLTRQGNRLYDQSTGLPWVPNAYTLTAPDASPELGRRGTQYELDAQGKITAVSFQDGAQWLVSDAGIAAVTGDTAQRIDIQRDSLGRIIRVTGPDAQGETASTVYRYDAQGRLALVRVLQQPPLPSFGSPSPSGRGLGEGSALGTPLAYDSQGKLFTDPITAKLGAAVNWLGDSGANQWTGELSQNTATTLAFNVRDSELASTVHTPGAQGAIVYAIATELPADATIEVTGVTLIGKTTVNGKQTLLVRVTEAGAKLIRLNGVGSASIRISVAGDLNRDGLVNGADSQAWEQNPATAGVMPYAPTADINGDGLTDAADRQLLYANVGFKANLAPTAAANLTQGKTHTDLATQISVSAIAEDAEGDSVFLRVINASHGSVKLSADGNNLIFTPEAGYAGQATITLQADDGYAVGAPIELNVNISGAALTAIRIANLAELVNMQTGQSTRIHAVGDFTDQHNVDLTAGSGNYLTLNTLDLSPLGKIGAITLNIDDARDLVSAKSAGAGLISLSRTATDAQQQTYTLRTVAAINIAQPAQIDPQTGEPLNPHTPLSLSPDVYPGTLTLIPGATRQLKVHAEDPNTGINSDIHEASQTTFAGSPETTEDYTDPDTGETTTYIYPAIPAVSSGTRYIVSDDSIASISESGLITALRSGQVTVSIIHLASVVDAYGSVSEQIIGQSDINLSVQSAQHTDNDPATAAPQTILVNAELGAAISAETGETVMIGAGALTQDTPVAISRTDLSSIDPGTTLFAGQYSGLQAIGAFNLNIGSAASAYPLQLAIPVQNGIAAQAGDEVWFLRKGKVLAEGSTAANLIYQDTWWIVDNGFITLDANGNAIAKTASPPYDGILESGEYMVYQKVPGVFSRPLELIRDAGVAVTFLAGEGPAVSFGLSKVTASITSSMISIIASMSWTTVASNFHFGVPQFAKIDIPTVNEPPVINISTKLPPVLTPYGNIVVPNIINAAASDSGVVTLSIENNPGSFNGKLKLRALFADGSHNDVQQLDNTANGTIIVDSSKLTTQDGKPFAVGSVSWQLVSIIPGFLPGDAPIEFPGNTARISPKTDMAATLTRTGIEFYRENKTIGQVNLVNKIGTGAPIAFKDQPSQDQSSQDQPSDSSIYLTGNKVQPIAFSTDLSRAYVAGTGVIYEIDLLTFQPIDSIPIPGGKNITSLASVGSLLIAGEGQSYGNGTSHNHNQLYAMDTNPGSSYKTFKTIKGTGIENSKLGVAGMAAGPDGQTLVIAVPKMSNTVTISPTNEPGDILILDFSTFDFKTGNIAAPVKANPPTDGQSGKTPQVITATHDENRYLVANISDYDRGLSTLTLTRDAEGKITSAQMEAIPLNQPPDKIQIDRLDIQRAQSAVLVEQNGIEYAIVSDDNYYIQDPAWKAMYEAPGVIFPPSGGHPILVGGSVSAPKVAVGGKLGIVKDPFGQAEYLGATLPLDGYGIINLSLSEDGNVLIGQLKGSSSANIRGTEYLSQKPSQSHAWDVKALIAATLAQPKQDRLQKHISLTATPNAEQSIANPGSEFKGTIGTAFDPEWINASVEGHMGDVIGVDLKELAARQLLVREGLLSEASAKLPFDKLSEEEYGLITTRMEEFSDFSVDTQLLNFFTGKLAQTPALKLLTNNVNASGAPSILSRKSAYASNALNSEIANFKDSGVLFFVPNINELSDIEKLRAGETLADKFAGLIFYFKDRLQAADDPDYGKGLVTITAKDYAPTANAFVGDRPLDNPGYTAFQLKSGIDTNAKDILDITRVEQRLKYLGFAATNAVTGKPEQEIKVGDGRFDDNEQKALKLYETVVRYTSAIGTGRDGNDIVEIQYRATVTGSGANNKTVELQEVPGSFKQLSTSSPTKDQITAARTAAQQNALQAAGYQSEADLNGIDGKIEADANNAQRKTTVDWLNAYNAPHWLQFFASLDIGYQTTNARLGTTRWTNQQTGGAKGSNVFGTSWVFDLMALSAKTAQIQGRTQPLQYAGSGNLGTTLELGINTQYISQPNQKQINGNEWLLGLSDVNSVDLKNVTASNAVNTTPQEKLKYFLQQKAQLGLQSNGQWNYTVANSLADLLKETNRAPVAGMSDIGNANSKRQDEALKDFLAVYAATLNDGVNGNGSLDEQINNITSATSNADKQKIQQALFGKGGNGAGLINSQNITLGGKGLGAKLDADSLAAIMNISKDEAVGWVDVLNQTLSSADINTPQRLSMFLANVAQETGQLRKTTEGGGRNYYIDRYWLNTTTRNGLGNTSEEDAVNFRGRGLLHITGRYNYEIATFGFRTTAPSNTYVSYNEWQGTQQTFNTTSTSNPDGTVTVTGTIPPGWSVRIIFPRSGSAPQEFGYFVDTHNTGTYSVTSQGQRPAGDVTVIAVQYNFLEDYEQISSNNLIGAQVGEWYWRFERGNRWDLNPRAADVNDFRQTVQKINAGELNPKNIKNLKLRLDKYTIAEKAVNKESSYGNMSEMLKNLGIKTVNAEGYNNKFGLSLNKRAAIDIDKNKHLFTEDVVANPAVNQQDLLQALQSQFDIEQGDDMLFLAITDVPPTPANERVLVATAPSSFVKALNYGVCEFVNSGVGRDDGNDLWPQRFITEFLPKEIHEKLENNVLDSEELSLVSDWMDNITVKRLQEPKHGIMLDEGKYLPNEGYIGKDRVAFLLEGKDLNGHPISMKLTYYINVMPESQFHNVIENDKNFQQALKKYCGSTAGTWQISGKDDASSFTVGFSGYDDLTPTVTFANLTGAAVGETQGSGTTATITLDTNAAGYGWYIDYTPYLNEDFLPTSNPNEWVAKAGSSAVGKMDMLSVLLHEYGHALGLEHSVDAHDFMGTTLTPGMRRLPSADELTLMAQLVAEAKQNLAGLDSTVGKYALTPTLSQRERVQDGGDTPSPIPTLPLGAGFGISFLGLTRRNKSSADSLFGETLSANTPAQYDIAANPTLVNGELNSADSWEATGNVDIIPSTGSGQAGGVAVLSEATTTQTRLNQVFVLGEHDRYLSFTLANTALGDQTAGPDDAFEAALLDANTGLSLLGATGLSHNDAFLNLQANGEEHKASGITRIDNAGSRTYIVDLAGIAAGTAVNLSFDLIGFGQGVDADNSQITVRNLRLGLPQVVNEAPTAGDQSLSTDEDTPITGSLLIVAADIDSALLQGSIVTGPQHGQVSVAADGSFTYTPNADYNGTDSFSYKVNDGKLDSNLATVTLIIAPVNDAPTTGNQSLSTDEDMPVTGSLLAVAADIDSALLQSSIVAGPQHGQVSIAADGSSFTYTPDADYNGADNFSYKVNDGESDSAIATVTLVIAPVNDAPVVSPIAATLLEDGHITLNLLGSASDVDGDPLNISVGNPQHGQLLKNTDGSYSYTPDADYNGEDSFSYFVSDGVLDSGSAMVRLTITAVNDAPVAQDDIATLDEDQSIRLAVMANDHDVDSDSLNLIIVSQPAHGTLVMNADNTVSYTPLENWSGEDSFSYKLNDAELDSNIATVRLIVTGVADAPSLVISEVGGPHRELFRTGWESVTNPNTVSTLLEQRELEGWMAISRSEQSQGEHNDRNDNHDNHGSFEIWSSGDKMRDAQGKLKVVNAATGNGSNLLELGNAKGEGHQTLGIERSIETIAGASYSLSLDLAGHLGYSADTTRISIYLDGVKIGSDASTSPSAKLNWQSREFQFTGKGGAQTLRIVSEADRRESNGRGMMIDNIALSETLQANTGFEDGAIPLSAIGALLRDTDGSEILTLTIGAIPLGAKLTDGVNSFTASQDTTTADITDWNLSKLTITPPKDFNGQLTLKIVATGAEQANQSKASVEADLQITVLPVNDAPTANNASYTLSQGDSLIIDFAGLIGDVDGDVLTLNFANPKRGKLSKNADASPEPSRRSTYTYTPKREFSGSDTFSYTVSDGKLSATANITLTVQPKKDHDDKDIQHNDNSQHSGHNSYQRTNGRSAKLIVQSIPKDTLVINQQASTTTSKIDWTGQAPDMGKLKQEAWVAEMMILQPKEQSLAEQTGLVVKMK